MADFCNQCAGHLGLPPGDLKGIGGKEKLEEGYGWPAFCEGCGPTLVDDEGNCVEDRCWYDHDTRKFRYNV